MSISIMKVSGSDGQMELFDNKVVVSRNGFLCKILSGFAAAKEIPIKNISLVEMQEAGIVSGGEFVITYNNSEKEIVKFQKKSNIEFSKFKEAIFNSISK